jgi:uncharacterized protein YjbJ (UPF0337 family)
MGSTADKLKGKLKKAEGELTGDKVREGQGWVEEKKGEVEGAVERAGEKIDQKIDRASEQRRENDPDRR